jgi:hypothetical protein
VRGAGLLSELGGAIHAGFAVAGVGEAEMSALGNSKASVFVAPNVLVMPASLELK